jgi:diadenosine tetraphosphate (Ap4A) HIT family hydrolase
MEMADIPPNAGQSLNATMRKFGAPGTCVRNYSHWTVLLRPAQVTLGSLVLAAFEPARALADLSRESFSELGEVVRDIEQSLARAFSFDKINYLLLMMVDPDVHFHVIPRYAAERSFAGVRFTDPCWPGVPDLSRNNAASDETMQRIFSHIRSCWN